MTLKTKTYLLVVFLLVCFDSALAQVPDPGTPGPLTVTREEYDFGDTAFQPIALPGPGSVGPVPKIVLNTVRVPLTAFNSVNLNDIRSVQFTFDERFQGAVLIADVAFASAPR